MLQVMKLPPIPYASCATKCYQTVLWYPPNFLDIVVIIVLNIRKEILDFRASARGINKLSEAHGEKFKGW